MEYFKLKEHQPKSFFDKLLFRESIKNCIIDINNLLVKRNIITIKPSEIHSIFIRYKVNSKKDLINERASILGYFLEFIYRREKVTEVDYKNIDHLNKLLELDSKTSQKIFQQVRSNLFNETLDKKFEKDYLNEEDHSSIEKFADRIKINESEWKSLYAIKAEAFIKAFMDQILKNERFSPLQEEKLKENIYSLKIDLSFDDATKAILEKYKTYWKLENEILSEIDAGINLPKNEKCYFMANGAEWHEYRKVTKRVDFGGPTARIKIAKGLYFRVGSIKVNKASEDVLQHLDTGRLYLTNKRIVFVGNLNNKSIQINKVLNFTVYSDGVDVIKDSGRTPFIKFQDRNDIFGILFMRLINE